MLQRLNSCQLQQTKDGPLDVKASLQRCQNVFTEPAGNCFNCWEKPPKSGCPKPCLAVCSGQTNQRWSCLSTVRGADQRRLSGEAWCWEWFGLGAACTRLLLRFDHIKTHLKLICLKLDHRWISATHRGKAQTGGMVTGDGGMVKNYLYCSAVIVW